MQALFEAIYQFTRGDFFYACQDIHLKTPRAINGASHEVLLRHIENRRRADPAYGEGVARAIGISTRELVPAKLGRR
jgi:hypothetical protein